LLSDLHRYEIVIRRLQDLLASYTIEVPASVYDVDGEQMPMAVAQLTGPPPVDQRLEVHMPPMSSTAFGATSIDPARGPAPSEGPDAAPVSSTQLDIPRQPAHSAALPSPSPGLSLPQDAVSFVLALEAPCLHHHPFASPELEEFGLSGTGHANMLSNPFMSRLAPSTLTAETVTYPENARCAVSAADLEHLLTLAERLPVESSEITPVQM